MKFSRRTVFAALAAATLAAALPTSSFAQKKIVLGFAQVGAESEWRTANTESIKQSAKDAGIELKFSDAQQKQENQIKAIRSYIAQKVDVIAFSPVVESGWDTVLQEAKAAKIPVILTDRSVDSKDTSLYVTFMGSDFTEEGRKAGRWLLENKKSAAADAGINLKFSDAQQKQENQIKAIRSYIAQKVDVIAFSPVVESGWEPVLIEAKNAKIPVILTDRNIDVKDKSLYVTMIGSDFLEEGRKAGRWLLENTKGAKQVNIVELQGTVGSAPAIDRKKGFEEVIKGDSKYKITRSQTGDFTRAKGKEVMEAFLKADKNIQVLYAHNDDMAIGAIQAIEEAGLKPGKDITIISIDAVKGAFEAMIAGKLNVSVECSPLLGPQLMQAVKDLKAGKTLPKRIVTQEGVFPMEVAAKEFPNRKY